jgi:hypothetical protein
MKFGRAIILSILLVAVSMPAAYTAGAAGHSRGLARIVIRDDADLARLEASGIPVYARTGGAEGIVLITGLGPVGALSASGLEARVLDPGAEEKRYYECYTLPHAPEPDWSAYGEVLHREDGYAILSMSSEGAGRLAETGVDLKAIFTDPKPLPEAAPAGPAPMPVAWSQDVQDIIDAVESLTVYNYTGDLSGEWPVTVGGSPYTIQTRHTYSGTPITRATEFVGEHLEGLGLSVEYHVWGGSGYPNVIAEIPGQVSPDSIVIICAHLDDMPYSTVAPGADDNASGSAAVLIAADIMSRYAWRYTLRFALWTGEEQGLYGSYYYAQRSYVSGEDIMAVLNLDMIAYNTQGSQADMDLHADEDGTPGSMDLAQVFVDVVDAYGIGLVPDIWENGLTASDHSSFWDYGYTAVLAIEDWDDFTPYYHSQSDLLQTLNMAFYVEFVKASVATFAHLGVVHDDPSGVGEVAGRGGGEPGVTMLHPARPNPAGSETVIRYDVARAGEVELKVYDIGGRAVRTLRKGHHAAGTYETTWNGGNDRGERIPPGVYFLSLRTEDGTSEARKVVLAR